MMNSAVTVGMPKRFFCQSRDCQPRWSKPGQPNAYSWKNQTEKSPSEETESGQSEDVFDLLLPPNVGEMEAPVDYSKFCNAVDCEFRPLGKTVSSSFYFFPMI